MKIVNIDGENPQKIFRKDVTYSSIKNKKSRASYFLLKIQFWKNHRVGQIDPSAF